MAPIPFLFLLLLLSAPAFADSLDVAARDLAKRVAAGAAGRELVLLSVRNQSSISPTEIASVRKAVESVLKERGQPEGDYMEVRVTISENPQEYLLIAEVGRGDDRRILVSPVPRSVWLSEPSSSTTLERRLLWEQREPILDAAVLEREGSERADLLILEPGTVVLYQRLESKWERRTALAVSNDRPWPRDLRGRIVAYGNSFRVYLPGVDCRGSLEAEPRMTCEPADAPWPVHNQVSLYGFPATDRNFFDSFMTVAKPQKEVPPFFSIAEVQQNGERSWLVAALDGRARLYDNELNPVASWPEWGSDLVGIQSKCGGGWQVLASGASDGSGPDSIQAFEVVERQAVPVSQAMQFAGPITALWPNGTSGAIAVMQTPRGGYAAYLLALSCAR